MPARSTASGSNARNRSDAFQGNDKTRGFNAIKAVLGELYGLDIQYYVMVNFDGFKSIVDTLGGVTINVQNPVLDDHYPGDHGRARSGSTSRPASSTWTAPRR